MAESNDLNVLMINGSRRARGCTYTALSIVGEELKAEGVDSRIIHVTDEGAVDAALAALDVADGLVLGTPVYWASPTGEIEVFLDKLWGRAKRSQLAGKPCAVLASARRAGTTSAIDDLAKYPTFAEMPLVSSFYWNMVHGNKPEEVYEDEEGMQIMRQLGRNMAWLLRCIEAGRRDGILVPDLPEVKRTNFIR